MRALPCVCALAAGVAVAVADTPIVLNATAEATILDLFDDRAIGFGGVFAGTTNFGEVRRGLVRFDLSGLPDGEILTAELSVFIERLADGGPFDVGVHRLETDWNEGPTPGGGQGGGVALPATPADATWLVTGLGTSWGTPGGDFVATPTSVRTMAAPQDRVFFDVTADVQAFRDGTPDFGWILVSQSEGVSQQIVKLSTDDSSLRPIELSVFIEPPNPADLNGDGVLDITDVDLFIVAFLGGDSAADLSEPFGIFDIDDIDAFIDAFLGP